MQQPSPAAASSAVAASAHHTAAAGSEPAVVLASGADARPGFAISPDGSRVVYSTGNPGGTKIIYVRNLDGSGNAANRRFDEGVILDPQFDGF